MFALRTAGLFLLMLSVPCRADWGEELKKFSCGRALSFLAASSAAVIGTTWFRGGASPPPEIETLQEPSSFFSTYGHDLSPTETAVVLMNGSDLEGMYPGENDYQCHGIACTAYGILRWADYSAAGQETSASARQKIQQLIEGKRATFKGVSGPRELHAKFPKEVREVITQVQAHQPAARINTPSLNYYRDFQRRFPLRGKLSKTALTSLDQKLKQPTSSLSDGELKAMTFEIENWQVGLKSGEPSEFVGVSEASFEEIMLSGTSESSWRWLPHEEREKFQKLDALELMRLIDKGLSPRLGIEYPKSSHAIRVVGYLKDKSSESASAFYVYDPNFPQTIRLALALRDDKRGKERWVFDNRDQPDVRKGIPNVDEHLVPVEMIWHPRGVNTFKVDNVQNKILKIEGR